MSTTLSTLIAFVSVIIVFSVLIQSVQEAIKNVLKPKASVWTKFLVDLIERDTKVPSKGARQVPTAIPAELKDAFSQEFVGDFGSQISQAKTLIRSTVALVAATKRVLSEICALEPTDPEFAKNLLPKARELAAAIKHITGIRFCSFLELYDKMSGDFAAALKNATEVFESAFPGLECTVNELKAAELVQLHSSCQALLVGITAAETRIFICQQKFERHVDTWIVRLNEKYQRRMLLWTVLTGLAFVIVSNADAFSIYKKLSVSRDTGAAVVAQAHIATQRLLTSNASDLNEIDAALAAGDIPKAKTAAINLSTHLASDFKTITDTTDETRADNIRAAIGTVPDGDVETARRAISKQQTELTTLLVKLHRTAITQQTNEIGSLELPLGWPKDLDALDNLRKTGGKDFAMAIFEKIAGLCLTVFLLVFGAPFWNDVLSVLIGIKNVGKSRAATA